MIILFWKVRNRGPSSPSGAGHFITTTYCVLLHAAPSIDRKWGPYIVMYYYYCGIPHSSISPAIPSPPHCTLCPLRSLGFSLFVFSVFLIAAVGI